MFKKEIKLPIITLVLLSLGGLLLHLRIHPPNVDPLNYIPFVIGLFTTLVLPFMFNCQKLYFAAYGINIVVVIVGVVGMAYFSISHWKGMPITLSNVVLQTTLADIIILLARLPIAHLILRHYEPETAK